VNEFDRNRLARSSVDIAARLKTLAGKTGRVQAEDIGSTAKAAKPGRADYLTVKAMLQERLLDEISFEAPDLGQKTIVIDEAYVDQMLADVVKNEDLSRYIL